AHKDISGPIPTIQVLGGHLSQKVNTPGKVSLLLEGWIIVTRRLEVPDEYELSRSVQHALQMPEHLDDMVLAFVRGNSPYEQHREQVPLCLRNGSRPRSGADFFYVEQQRNHQRLLVSQVAQLLGIELRIADGGFHDRPKQLKLFSANFRIA